MKNLLLALFVMTAMAFSNNIQAQASCTPEQIEACKKICGNNASCTPAQMEACKKICSGSSATATAVKVVNKAPSDAPNCQPACSKTSTTEASVSPVKLVGLDLIPKEKKMNCSKPCARVQE